MDGKKRTRRTGTMRPVMTRLPPEIWTELEAIAQREASTVAAVLRRLAMERLEQRRAIAPQDRWAEMLEFANAHVAQRVSESITIRDQPVPSRHHAWYEDTLRAVGYELDRRAAHRVTIVELEQRLLVCGHQSAEDTHEYGRFEWVLTAEDLMALLDEAYDRRSRERAATKAS